MLKIKCPDCGVEIKNEKVGCASCAFENMLRLVEAKAPVREFKFHATRDWRSDFAWVEEKVIVEIEGGVFSKRKDGSRGGRHNTGQGFIGDMEKYNEATRLGYKVFRFTPEQIIESFPALFIKEVLNG